MTYLLQLLRFRDVLRSNPELAARYAELKAGLAEQHTTDREAYTDAKSAFVLANVFRPIGR